MSVLTLVPSDVTKIGLVLFLSFLLGLEREEHKATTSQYAFGGVRTFPLIGLTGYGLALLSGTQLLPVSLGFAVVGAFLLLSYWHKLHESELAGVTTEISGLLTYVLGALICFGHYWVAATLVVSSLLLLELRGGLRALAVRIAPEEILAFTKFLLVAGVVLPILPNEELTRFHINPFQTWLVVVAVSGISYASYALQKIARGRGGVVLAALLGGAYSSTLTTVALARESRRSGRPSLFAGAIVVASGVMYARMVLLIALFNGRLARVLAVPFLALAAVGIVGGLLFARRNDGSASADAPAPASANPLEIRSAILFAALFLGVVVIMRLVRSHLGSAGIYGLASIMGLTDVDPFVLGMAQSGNTPGHLAATAIVVAAAANNLAKGLYAFGFGGARCRLPSLAMMGGFAALGMLPLLWLRG